MFLKDLLHSLSEKAKPPNVENLLTGMSIEKQSFIKEVS